MKIDANNCFKLKFLMIFLLPFHVYFFIIAIVIFSSNFLKACFSYLPTFHHRKASGTPFIVLCDTTLLPGVSAAFRFYRLTLLETCPGMTSSTDARMNHQHIIYPYICVESVQNVKSYYTAWTSCNVEPSVT